MRVSAHEGRSDPATDIRRELARELHDRVAQTLTTMLVELENFKSEQAGRQGVLRQLDELQESTRDVLSNLRAVLYGLRGEEGVEEGFVDSVRGLLARFQDRTQMAVGFSVAPTWPSRLSTSAALNIYRIIEEALTNVRLHSGAGRVDVALGPSIGSTIAIEVTDDGSGSVSADGAVSKPGLGVMGMRERALLLGGRLEVDSDDGRGTTVRAILPREQLI
jgi:two-component system sensor histidine kinase UhpB